MPPDFRELKRAVSIERVLRARGLFALRPRGRRLVGPCPIHGGDNTTAFVVDVDKGLWFCFTRCRAGGDVVELVRRLDRCGFRDAALELERIVQPDLDCESPPERSGAAPNGKPPFRPFTRQLQLTPAHPFLARKGILAATATAFDTGSWDRPGFLQGCIGVRLHDPDGRPLGYAGRRLDDHQASALGKWKVPPGLPKSQVLYNYHRVRDRLDGGLVLVECPWGVMRLAQIDIPAVALLGTALHPTQHRLLAAAGRILLLLDGDTGGRGSAASIRETLAHHVAVQIAELPDGADPDDLTDIELGRLTSSFLGCRPPAALDSPP